MSRRRAQRGAALRGSQGGGAGSEPPLAPRAPAPASSATHTAASYAPLASYAPRVVAVPAPRGRDDAPPASVFERALALPLGALTPLLSCFNTRAARVLREVSRAAEAHIAAHAWADMSTPVIDLAKWRACFPHATALKLSPRVAWPPEAVVYLAADIAGLDASGVRNLEFLEALRDTGIFARLSTAKLRGCPGPFLVDLVTFDATPACAAAAGEALPANKDPVALTVMSLAAIIPRLQAGSPPAAVAARLSLLVGCDWRNKADTAQAISTFGGIEHTIACLRAYKGYPRVVENAAMLLNRLMELQPIAKVVAQAGPAPALCEALDCNPGKPFVAAATCAVLFGLIQIAPSTARVVLSSGGPRILLAVMGSCIGCELAVENANIVLAALLTHVKDRAVAATLAVPGVADTLLAALSAYGGDASFASMLITTLAILHCNGGEEVVAPAVRVNGLRTLVQIGAMHASDAKLLQGATAALSAAFTSAAWGGGKVDVAPLLAAGVVDTILAAIATNNPAATDACTMLHQIVMEAPGGAARLLTTYPIVATLAGSLGGAPPAQLQERLHLLYACLEAAPGVGALQLTAPGVGGPLAATLARVQGRNVAGVTSILKLIRILSAPR